MGFVKVDMKVMEEAMKERMSYKDRVEAAYQAWEKGLPLNKAAIDYDVDFEDILKRLKYHEPLQWFVIEASALYHKIKRKLGMS